MKDIDKDLLALTIIIVAFVIAFLFAKISLIWKDVMLKNNEKNKKYLERFNYLKSIKNNPITREGK